ncbi:hypothetical protein GF324_14105 [bacterium]|nr:hypothetical protein [bacterium]
MAQRPDRNGGRSSSKELIALEEYMIMSAELHYQLTPHAPDPFAILSKIFGGRELLYKDTLVEAIKLLLYAYKGKYRELGPEAVLHPLRVAAIIMRCMKAPTLLDLLGALLHDMDEDLTPDQIGRERWDTLQELYHANSAINIDAEHQWYLGERLAHYTRVKGQPYHEYLGLLCDSARKMPDLLHVKLSDRLDNTLDTHIYLPGVTKYNFYRFVFDLLFVPGFKGVEIDEYHVLPTEQEGVKLLSQLFKNSLFLSILRQEGLDKLDDTTHRLFNGLAVASIREAQWIALELFSSDEILVQAQRELVLATMVWTYNQEGIKQVRTSTDENLLDGTFLERFAVDSKQDRTEALSELFMAKPQLAEVLIAFIATFAKFLNDPDFYIEGIRRKGIQAV